MKLSKAQKIFTPAFPAVNRSSRISPEVFPHPLWPHDSGTGECCVSCSCSSWWCLWWCRAAVFPLMQVLNHSLGFPWAYWLIPAQHTHLIQLHTTRYLFQFPSLSWNISHVLEKIYATKSPWQVQEPRIYNRQLFRDSFPNLNSIQGMWCHQRID